MKCLELQNSLDESGGIKAKLDKYNLTLIYDTPGNKSPFLPINTFGHGVTVKKCIGPREPDFGEC